MWRESGAALLAASLLCFAQQPAPTFRAQTTLVEFTIVALDSKGNPVTNLKKEELTITENGQRREVAFFRFDGGKEVAPAPKRLPAGTFSNRAEYTPGPPLNVTAIVLDALNTPVADQMVVREQVVDYLRTVPPDHRVAAYGLGHELIVLYDFNDEAGSSRAEIMERVKKFPLQVSTDVEDLECFALLFRNPQVAESICATRITPIRRGGELAASAESVYYQRTAERRRDHTLAALESLGNHLAGIPGRKNLVWIGGGVSIFSITGVQKIGNPYYGFRSYEARIRGTAQRLASQGIALYPVDSLALARAAGTPKPSPQANPVMQVLANVVSNYDPISSMEVMANLTGGRAVKFNNDLTQGMKLAAADLRGAYSVGFYALAGAGKQWRRVAVRTKRRGVTLAYRQGYLPEVGAPQPEDWSVDEWRETVYRAFGSTAIHMDAVTEMTPSPGANGVTVILQVATRDLHLRQGNGQLAAEVEITMAEKTSADEFNLWRQPVTLSISESQAKGMDTAVLRYQRRWEVDPTTTFIRVIVRDRFTGRYGTLDVPVNQIPRRAPL